ncbi:MAG: hypothetical protein ACYSSP_02880 [Planctomycetota bacterium]|jgi:hypothetical protein
MENENLEQDKTEEKDLAENLQFMRLAIEKTHKEVDPEAHVMIVWGLVCMIGYITIHFLVINQLYKWIWPVYLPLLAIGGCVTIVSGIRVSKQQKKAGVISQVSRQIGWVWCIVLAHGVVWSTLGLFNDFFGGMGFLWALVYSIALSMMGIIFSKEWLFGGILIFAGMVAAFFIKDYAYIILGLAMGIGCIVPAIIAQRNYRKQEKVNAQA